MHPIFRDCVAREPGRYSLTEPFVISGYIYATDGRICVRQKTDLPDTTREDGREYPPVGGLSWASLAGEPAPLPSIPDKPVWKVCICCERCVAWTSRRAVLAFGEVLLISQYIRILLRHGATAFAAKAGEPVRFVIGEEIEGLLMPINSAPNCPEVWTPEQYAQAAIDGGEPW